MDAPLDDEQVLERLPGVRVDSDNIAWFAGVLGHRLVINRCDDCGRWHHPPRSICPACWSRTIVPTEVSGRGVVELVTILHQGPRRGGADYTGGWPVVGVALTEQEGLRVTGTMIGVPNDEIRLGMEVEVAWIDNDDGPPLVAFTPRESDAGRSASTGDGEGAA